MELSALAGNAHVKAVLSQQEGGRGLSHAYILSGPAGLGRHTLARLLCGAMLCADSGGERPCGHCAPCRKVSSGVHPDVTVISGPGEGKPITVDQVRALRDEAVYTPAAVRKRVYIVDEVHMLSTPAFNALLKILEEPPAHLMFILATTELHKVPATIKSRCQQFSFKRILPGQIAQRLGYVAQQEGIDLTREGAALLARLADGGLRDALSLLDQCAGGGKRVDEQDILDTLGLAGNLETAKLMGLIAGHDTAGALDPLARLYGNGKDVGSVLEELSSLARDLLLRKTAPQGGAALLTGGYDEATMRALGEQLTAPRLLQMLKLLQNALPDLARSTNRRTDAELCLIRLSDERLDDSFAGLAARVARLEEQLAGGAPVPAPVPARTAPAPAAPAPQAVSVSDAPPWEEERPPLPPEPEEEPSWTAPQPERPAPPPAPAAPRPAPAEAAESSAFWPSFVAGLRGKVPPSVLPYLNNSAKVAGVWKNGALTLWVDTEFTRAMLNKPAILQALSQAASTCFGVPEARVSVVVGQPPASQSTAQEPAAQPQAGVKDALDELLAFGAQFDNIKIQ